MTVKSKFPDAIWDGSSRTRSVDVEPLLEIVSSPDGWDYAQVVAEVRAVQNEVKSFSSMPTLPAQSAHAALVGPVAGPPASPSFRALIASDIPSIAESQVTGLVSDLAAKSPLAGSSSITTVGTLSAGDVSATTATATGSTTARTIATRWADWFNVRDFGATGDGSTDDTAAIQAAINAAAAVGVNTPDLQSYSLTPLFKGGGTVYVPPGVYIVTGLALGNRVTLQGDGLGSIIKLKANTLAPVIRNAYGSDMICIRDLRVDGNRFNQAWSSTRTVTDGAMAGGAVTSSSSFVLTSATANFTSNDLYARINVHGAGLTGANGNSNVPVFIQSVTNSTTVKLTDRPSSTNLTGLTVDIEGWNGRTVSDGSATLNSYTLTSATANFASSDVFSSITVSGAGSSSGALTTFIRSVESSTSCTLADFAATSSSNATVTITPRQDGILIMQRPTSPKTSDRNAYEDYDANSRIYNVLIHNCRGDGLHTAGRGDHFFANVKAYMCDGAGFYFEQDVFGSCLNAGQIGQIGFDINGAGIKLEGCKAWYCGLVGGNTHGDGFRVTSGVQAKINGGEAQDNNGHGFAIINGSGVALTGCTADSNGASFVNTGPQGAAVGYNLFGATGCVIDGCIAMDEFRNVTPQDAALLIRGSSPLSLRNVIRLQSNQNNGFFQANPFISANSDSSLTGGNVIEINQQRGFQTIAYASTITPDPYLGEHVSVGVLTNNITIANPVAANYRNQNTTTYNSKTSGGHAGCRLTLLLTQDGTGGRTVTWGNKYVFPNTVTIASGAGAVTVVKFVFDGTNWVCLN